MPQIKQGQTLRSWLDALLAIAGIAGLLEKDLQTGEQLVFACTPVAFEVVPPGHGTGVAAPSAQ